MNRQRERVALGEEPRRDRARVQLALGDDRALGLAEVARAGGGERDDAVAGEAVGHLHRQRRPPARVGLQQRRERGVGAKVLARDHRRRRAGHDVRAAGRLTPGAQAPVAHRGVADDSLQVVPRDARIPGERVPLVPHHLERRAMCGAGGDLPVERRERIVVGFVGQGEHRLVDHHQRDLGAGRRLAVVFHLDLEGGVLARLDQRLRRPGLHLEAGALHVDGKLHLGRGVFGKRHRAALLELPALPPAIDDHDHVLDEGRFDRDLHDRRRLGQLQVLLGDHSLARERHHRRRRQHRRSNVEPGDLARPVRRLVGDDRQIRHAFAGRVPRNPELRGVLAAARVGDPGERRIRRLVVDALERARDRRRGAGELADLRVEQLGVVPVALRSEHAFDDDLDRNAGRRVSVDVGHDGLDARRGYRA